MEREGKLDDMLSSKHDDTDVTAHIRIYETLWFYVIFFLYFAFIIVQ
jgi:hypothetical protein